MKTIVYIALLIVAAAVSAVCMDKIPAFPGVEGDGSFATGGRGGAVVHVTNLNPTGPGSLTDAVSQSNRIVVFDVSGIIDLSGMKGGKKDKPGKENKKIGGKISIEQPNITIAGQTAPGEGICLKGGALEVAANNIIIRYLRSRRGWNREGDMGDCINVKPNSIGEKTTASGQSSEVFEARRIKKESRGKYVHKFIDLINIVVDHCSTSWTTDENLTVTHANLTTVSWSIAAEGCDYTNPRQTPPNHSEGSLWGSSAPDGRSTMHHMLFAHNRLRNPRTTSGDDTPAVLTLYNSVIYDWSEYPTHTGSERVHLQWLNNFYKPGPSTPTEARLTGFHFHGDPLARVFASGNVIEGSADATRNNRLAVAFDAHKFKNVSAADKAAMVVDKPWTDLPSAMQSATAAYESVLAGVGAILPARDAVDLRIVADVHNGTGKVIEKETDLPVELRWPDYRALPRLPDADNDGIPDFWEKQFGLNPNDPTDSATISAGGYANIEHYFNNTDPTGDSTPIVYIAATVSRALPKLGQTGEWRVTRTGSVAGTLTVNYTVTGKDYEPLPGQVIIPAGAAFATIKLTPTKDGSDNTMVVVALDTGKPDYHVGCPSVSLVVIRR